MAPVKLLLTHRPRSHLDLMIPHSLKDRVQQHQQKQKSWHDQHAKPCAYTQGDLVFILNKQILHGYLALLFNH